MQHRHLAVSAVLFALSACATATTPEAIADREQAKADAVFADDPRRGALVDKVCFTRQIDSFGETTKRAVVIREGRDYYLVETFPGCFDLDWAQSLAFDSFSSCLSKGDRLVAFDNAFAHTDRKIGQPQTCRVKAIYDWDRDAEAEKDQDETASPGGDDPVEIPQIK